MISQRFSRLSSELGILVAIGMAVLVAIPVFLLAQSASAPQAAAPQSVALPATTRTAGQAYKNIQVLKDIPAEQLVPSMDYVSASLGVRCQFCHVPRHPEKDDKKEKLEARKMIQMMFAIDNDNFEGRKEVTCYTCHRGSTLPARGIELSDAVGAPPPGVVQPVEGQDHEDEMKHEHDEPMASPSNGPATSVILAKYAAALGTADALAKFSSSAEKGTLEFPSEHFEGALETDRMVPNMVLTILETPEGVLRQAYDGKVAWEKNPQGRVRDLTGPDLTDAKVWAPIFPALDIERAYGHLRVAGTEEVGGEDAWRVLAFPVSGPPDQYFFSKRSGLLLRLQVTTATPLGDLPSQTNFEDYHAVGGAQIPLTIRVVEAGSVAIYKWNSVTPGAPLSPGLFRKPATLAEPSSGSHP
jgi:photosynthetic reaction center cytochrome c subunit